MLIQDQHVDHLKQEQILGQDRQCMGQIQDMYSLKQQEISMLFEYQDGFDKREVGRSTFQVEEQRQDMLTSFEENVITKLEGFGHKSLINKNNGKNADVSRNISGGK